MPTYEYQCDACNHNFDEFQSFSDEPLKKCPKCGKRKLRRVFGTGAAIIFKGSGFYQTDYRSESYKQAAKKEQEAAAPAAGDKKGDKTGTSDSGSSQSAGEKSNATGKSSKSSSE